MQTQFTSNFKIIRLLSDELVASNCEIKIDIALGSIDNDRHTKNSIKAIKLWLESFLNESIIYYPGTEIDINMFEQLANNMILTPDEPNDYHVCLLIHSKLNAIGQGYITVSKTEFESDTGEGFRCVFNGSTDEWLPSQEEWIGPNSVFELPWWKRSDGSTLDVPVEEGDDVAAIKKSLTINLLDLIDDKDKKTDAETAEIIKAPFKLKLLNDDE